jgi:hypothetical protein
MATVTDKKDSVEPETRWSARKKADVVMRLLRGESLEEVSRDVKVEAHRLAAWREDFIASGIEGLKANPSQPVDRRVRDLERKVGELALDNDILRAAARKRGLQIPPRKRPR